MRVHEAMTTDVLTTTPETSLKEAALEMARHKISGMPVVTTERELVGVISEADVLVKEAVGRPSGGLFRWLAEPDTSWASRADAITVGEAMSAPALTIAPDRPLTEAATIMLDEGVNRLPVVDQAGALVGLVSRGDLVKAFARTDDEIRAEIEEDVIHRVLWLDRARVQVTVDCGVVSLKGEVESAADAELLPSFVRRVPGVTSVDSALTYRNS